MTDLTMYSVRTDLALEARDMAVASRSKAGMPGNAMPNQLPGVDSETSEEDGILITRLHVKDEEGARAIGKLMGRYITIEVPGLRIKDSDLQDRVATRLAQEFSSFLERIGTKADAKVLIIGLGNWNVTPDALGPMVVENVMVTRHYFELMPDQVSDGYRQVSAVAPGVLGTTGIETSEIVQGIVDRTKPDLVIAIDALASKALERVNTTIQIADTGIHPGSGVGNKRKGLTLQALGVPVIAIGVPTVVYASTIVGSTIDLMKRHLQQHTQNTGAILGLLDGMSEQERLGMVKEVLDPLGHDLLVTPKDIDQFIEDMANIIASGLNAALHQAVDQDNVAAYTH
ncbi:GPR endopeptidase [Paenibacillus sp. y28]|uniref:GPR endopeptidase n=1 Tax=Paenibacillus sp. y28 TaxID=3129110 RepID=UPI0030164B02